MFEIIMFFLGFAVGAWAMKSHVHDPDVRKAAEFSERVEKADVSLKPREDAVEN